MTQGSFDLYPQNSTAGAAQPAVSFCELSVQLMAVEARELLSATHPLI